MDEATDLVASKMTLLRLKDKLYALEQQSDSFISLEYNILKIDR